ncbi:glucosyltransferase [Armillaria solidipes]|uniref:Dol-P-Glc:Glc(2)Man(9)GlcNAc(2)-PP-Dol alpha-1,2-glucosyltransferase n=1 Tax=Armillaria solidipes TaxID=1076256 RepID=A0A2H3CPG8_9AGAR|nr:glucosyltransferase [Armillaria solidipes]
MSAAYLLYCGICVTVLKELNSVVLEPYMDEPFHIPQAQAYCRGEFTTWDPKITTPPGLYVMGLMLKSVFMFKCTIPMLRLTTTLILLALPLVLTRLLCFHQRVRPPTSILSPTLESLVLASFPIAWFFGFLYYTEVPSLVSVVLTVVAAAEGRHWLAALLGLISCTFRQTNIIWVIYAFASSQLMEMRFRRPTAGSSQASKLYDPPASAAVPSDLIQILKSAPAVLPELLRSFVPYMFLLGFCVVFVTWNGGIVLGDKSNHVPVVHIPQMYYFAAFATAFGWPILIAGNRGVVGLIGDIRNCMFGSKSRSYGTLMTSVIMAVTVHKYTIHHPFLLSDNRHYTFYVWRRIYMLHSVVPYMLIPVYIACGWAWFLRVGRDQTLLQTLILPMFALLTLIPTPLLEPRYFLIPYILLRSQVADVPLWGMVLEGGWYAAINAVTMFVFLYLPRDGVGRFMW